MVESRDKNKLVKKSRVGIPKQNHNQKIISPQKPKK